MRHRQPEPPLHAASARRAAASADDSTTHVLPPCLPACDAGVARVVAAAQADADHPQQLARRPWNGHEGDIPAPLAVLLPHLCMMMARSQSVCSQRSARVLTAPKGSSDESR